MKLFTYFVFILNFTFLACGKKKTATPETVPQSYGIDGSEWVVASRACGTQLQEISSVEKIRFDNGFLVHFFLGSEDQSKICIQAEVFSRTVEQSNKKSDSYHERATLSGQKKRIVCKDKTSKKFLSDDTTDFYNSPQALDLNISANRTTVDLTGSPFCLSDVLHFELIKR